MAENEYLSPFAEYRESLQRTKRDKQRRRAKEDQDLSLKQKRDEAQIINEFTQKLESFTAEQQTHKAASTGKIDHELNELERERQVILERLKFIDDRIGVLKAEKTKILDAAKNGQQTIAQLKSQQEAAVAKLRRDHQSALTKINQERLEDDRKLEDALRAADVALKATDRIFGERRSDENGLPSPATGLHEGSPSPEHQQQKQEMPMDIENAEEQEAEINSHQEDYDNDQRSPDAQSIQDYVPNRSATVNELDFKDLPLEYPGGSGRYYVYKCPICKEQFPGWNAHRQGPWGHLTTFHPGVLDVVTKDGYRDGAMRWCAIFIENCTKEWAERRQQRLGYSKDEPSVQGSPGGVIADPSAVIPDYKYGRSKTVAEVVEGDTIQEFPPDSKAFFIIACPLCDKPLPRAFYEKNVGSVAYDHIRKEHPGVLGQSSSYKVREAGLSLCTIFIRDATKEWAENWQRNHQAFESNQQHTGRQPTRSVEYDTLPDARPALKEPIPVHPKTTQAKVVEEDAVAKKAVEQEAENGPDEKVPDEDVTMTSEEEDENVMDRATSMEHVPDDRLPLEYPKGSGYYYLLDCPSCHKTEFLWHTPGSNVYDHLRHKHRGKYDLKSGRSVVIEAMRRCGIYIHDATKEWAVDRQRQLGWFEAEQMAEQTREDTSPLSTVGTPEVDLPEAEQETKPEHDAAGDGMDEMDVDGIVDPDPHDKFKKKYRRRTNPADLDGDLVNSTLEFIVEDGIYVNPPCMMGVPKETINESSPYWDPTWWTEEDDAQYHRERITRIEGEVRDYEANALRDDEYQKGANALKKKLAAARAHAADKRRALDYLRDVNCPHPNQLLAKEWIPHKGLLNSGHLIYLRSRIKSLLQFGVEDPVQWLRQKWAEMIYKGYHKDSKPFAFSSDGIRDFLKHPDFLALKEAWEIRVEEEKEAERQRRRELGLPEEDEEVKPILVPKKRGRKGGRNSEVTPPDNEESLLEDFSRPDSPAEPIRKPLPTHAPATFGVSTSSGWTATNVPTFDGPGEYPPEFAHIRKLVLTTAADRAPKQESRHSSLSVNNTPNIAKRPSEGDLRASSENNRAVKQRRLELDMTRNTPRSALSSLPSLNANDTPTPSHIDMSTSIQTPVETVVQPVLQPEHTFKIPAIHSAGQAFKDLHLRWVPEKALYEPLKGTQNHLSMLRPELVIKPEDIAELVIDMRSLIVLRKRKVTQDPHTERVKVDFEGADNVRAAVAVLMTANPAIKVTDRDEDRLVV